MADPSRNSRYYVCERGRFSAHVALRPHTFSGGEHPYRAAVAPRCINTMTMARLHKPSRQACLFSDEVVKVSMKVKTRSQKIGGNDTDQGKEIQRMFVEKWLQFQTFLGSRLRSRSNLYFFTQIRFKSSIISHVMCTTVIE